MWIPIFKGGRQKDSRGREHDGDALIEKAVKTFNVKEHEPPLVLGHPETNAPAYGWVRGLRRKVRDGVAILEAKVKQVAPEFKAWVNSGAFKKRSASFYQDGRLRHVGFLGAAPPAVKGLPDVSFSGSGEEVINFGVEKREPEKAAEFTAADVEAMVKRAAENAKTQAEIEFAERESRREREERKADMERRVDQLVNDGILPPALVNMGLKEFLEFIDSDGEMIEFSEESGRDPVDPVELFFEFMSLSNRLGLFGEIATKVRVAKQLTETETGEDLARRANAK